MTEVTTIVDSYLAMWNETDPSADVLIEQTWTETPPTSTRMPRSRAPRHRRADRPPPAAVPGPPLRPRRRHDDPPRPHAVPWQLAGDSGTHRHRDRLRRVAHDGRLRDVTGFLEAARRYA